MATFPERGLAWTNGALVTVADALLQPLAGLPPLVSLLVLSLLTAALIVLVIARTSDQARVRRTKRRIQAALFEIRLFNDDPRIVLRAVADALRHNLAYLRLSAVPLAILSIPLLLIVAQLDAFYGYTGLHPGTPTLLKVEWRGDDAARGDGEISLDVPAAVNVETGPVRLVGAGEVLWRITPAAPGDFVLTIRVGDDTVDKSLHVSNQVARRSRARVAPGIISQLLHPSEPPLAADSPLSAVIVTYPERAIEVFGLRVHWMVVYLALTVVWSLVLAWGVGVSV